LADPTFTNSVLDEIVDRAHTDPHHPAANDPDRNLSYSELIDEVARVGGGMRARGVREGDHVALLIPNSVDFVVAALAALWIGAVFVPLATTDPESRVTMIVTDCSPALIATSSRGDGDHFATFDTPTASLAVLRDESPAPQVMGDSASRVAYMIYTSGTTGTPKGVQIGNAAFAAATRSTAKAVGMSHDTTTLCVSPFHFDGSYANLFSTLIMGGTVVIRPREALLFPRTFFNTVEREKVTYSGFTPSYLRLLLASPQLSSLDHSTLEIIALGGEAIAAGDLRSLWTHAPGIRVFNRYGPTETTIAVTNFEVTPESLDDGEIAIGQPHPGVTFALIDDEGRPVARPNEVGELYVGGIQLMDGYWANPDLTESVIKTDVVANERMYRTGDLVYRDERNNYVYVDRVDRVIKRNGVRTSLVELSTSLRSLKDIDAAACVLFDRDGELGIVAFVASSSNLSAIDIRRAASQLIPDTMLPDRFEIVSDLPLNKSNQLDETQLLASSGLQPFQPRRASDPRT
jgi:D-alanine--poly(phosphoribitol) ligase subunit 1